VNVVAVSTDAGRRTSHPNCADVAERPQKWRRAVAEAALSAVKSVVRRELWELSRRSTLRKVVGIGSTHHFPCWTRFSGRASPEVPQKHHRSSGRFPHMRLRMTRSRVASTESPRVSPTSRTIFPEPRSRTPMRRDMRTVSRLRSGGTQRIIHRSASARHRSTSAGKPPSRHHCFPTTREQAG
jgi:hypothetical protein